MYLEIGIQTKDEGRHTTLPIVVENCTDLHHRPFVTVSRPIRSCPVDRIDKSRQNRQKETC